VHITCICISHSKYLKDLTHKPTNFAYYLTFEGSFPMCVDGLVQIWLLLALWFYWWGFPFCLPSHYLPSFENSDVPSIIISKNFNKSYNLIKIMMVYVMYLVSHVFHCFCTPQLLCAPIYVLLMIWVVKRWTLWKKKTSFWTWLVVWHNFIKLSGSMMPNWPFLYVLYWWVFDSYYGWMIKINFNFYSYLYFFVQFMDVSEM
jgi:hypothetical protein